MNIHFYTLCSQVHVNFTVYYVHIMPNHTCTFYNLRQKCMHMHTHICMHLFQVIFHVCLVKAAWLWNLQTKIVLNFFLSFPREWYKRNISLLWSALQANVMRTIRRLKQIKRPWSNIGGLFLSFPEERLLDENLTWSCHFKDHLWPAEGKGVSECVISSVLDFVKPTVSQVDGSDWVRGLDLFEAMVTNTDSLLLSVPLPEECELNDNFMMPCHRWFCNWTWIAEGKGVLECFLSVWVCETNSCPGWWCVLIFEGTCLLRWPWAVDRTLKLKS